MVGRAGSSCARATCPPNSLLVSRGRGSWVGGTQGLKAQSLEMWPCPGTGLSSELRSVLVMMLEPDPKLRATAEALLALPMLRQPRPWSVLWYMAAEALSRGWALWQVSWQRWQPVLLCSLAPGPAQPPSAPCSPQALLALLCWLWHGLAHPASWLQPLGPPATPPGSPPCSLLLDSSLSSNWDDDSIGWVMARAGGQPHTRGPGPSPWASVVSWDPSRQPGPHPRKQGIRAGGGEAWLGLNAAVSSKLGACS